MRINYCISIYLCLLLFCCSTGQNNKENTSGSKNSSNSSEESESSDNDESIDDNENSSESEVNDYESNNGCKYEDGTYSATVDYNNPETGYSQTYTLEVEIQDCQVIQINFPRGGYLDDDHISPTDLDDNGDAQVEGEDGKTYDIHID